MDTRKILYGTLAYLAITFPLAVLWHLMFFGETYESLGYINREEPSFLLGFLSMVVQGGVMTFAYPLFCRNQRDLLSGLKFGLLAGLFFWSSHVLAFAAKHELSSIPLYFSLESLFLALQFGFSGLVIGWIYRNPRLRARKASQASRIPGLGIKNAN
jgi:hypothetical protein